MAYSAFEVSTLIKTAKHLPRANAQIGFTPVSVDRHGTSITPDKVPGVMACSYILKPKSRGHLRITSADADAPMYIQPNYLQHPDDQKDSVDLFRLTRKLFVSAAMQAFKATEMMPGKDVKSDEEIIDHYLKMGNSALHATGTCQMGTSEKSVVNEKLQVRGIANLRVVDLSIFPEIISGNTNSPAMAVGWRAADLILAS